MKQQTHIWSGDLVAILVILLAALESYRYVLDFGFTGTDAIPTVAAAKVDGLDALLEVLGRELRGGTADSGLSYYRPLTLITYAVDFLMWGWSPQGYHLTDLMLHALASAMVFLAARAAMGMGTMSALLASTIFLLHPAALEVVPAVSRREEPLLVIGLALSVIGASRVPRRLGWAMVILGSVIAVASVERGLVIPVVVFDYFLTFDDAGSNIFERVRAALIQSLPSLTVAAGFFLLRGVVLEDSRGFYFSWSSLVVMPAYATLRLVYPQEFLFTVARPASLGMALLLGAALLTVASLLMWVVLNSHERATHIFVIVSVGAYFLLCGIAGQMNPWYVYPAVPALAFSLAALARETFWKLKQGSFVAQGIPYLVGTVALVTLVVYPSPAFHEYRGWRVANHLASTVLNELQSLAESVPDDTAIVAINVPVFFQESDSDAFVTRAAAVLLPRTVRVWAEVNGIENEILVLGNSWQVGFFRKPTVELLDGGTIRIYFPPGPAQYTSESDLGGSLVPASMGNGQVFSWPPKRMTREHFQAYVFDGERFVHIQTSGRPSINRSRPKSAGLISLRSSADQAGEDL